MSSGPLPFLPHSPAQDSLFFLSSLDIPWYFTGRGGRPPRPEGRGFHAPGWLRCGPAGATSFPPRPEGRGFSEDLDEAVLHDGEVLRRGDGPHTGKRGGFARVDGVDARMGVRATQNLAVQ